MFEALLKQLRYNMKMTGCVGFMPDEVVDLVEKAQASLKHEYRETGRMSEKVPCPHCGMPICIVGVRP